MLHSEITIWDILWIIHTVATLAAIWIAYKKGEEHGENKAKLKRKHKPYSLPPKVISAEEFIEAYEPIVRSRPTTIKLANQKRYDGRKYDGRRCRK